MPAIQWQPLKHQRAPFLDDDPFVILVGGYGCVAPKTMVFTEHGPMPIEEIAPFTRVFSYMLGKLVLAHSLGGYRKGRAVFHEVSHGHGSLLATGHHRIFSASNRYQQISQLGSSAEISLVSEYYLNLLRTSSGSCLLASMIDALNLKKKASDYHGDYSVYSHQYGQQLHQAANDDLASAPSRGDAEGCDLYSFHEQFVRSDVRWGQALRHNHLYQSCGHPSKIHSIYQSARPEAVLVGLASSSRSELIFSDIQLGPKFHGCNEFHHTNERSFHSHTFLAPFTTTNARIRERSSGEYWDMHVLGTNNYITVDGSIHHNSGKSDWLCHKVLRLASQNKGIDGGLLCPDIKMFKRDILPIIESIKRKNNLRISYNRQDGFLSIPETGNRIWIFHDQDKGESIRGPNLAFFGVNEATLISKEGLEAAMGRVRVKEARVPQIAMSGTPEGFGYIYREFVEKKRTDTKVYFGKTKDNPHLHPSFIQRLEASYDPVLLKAYLEGQFVNLTGSQAAYAFSRERHVEKCPYEPGRYKVWVSMDFNVNPMTATLFYRVTDHPRVLLWAFDEIRLRTSDTNEMSRALRDMVGTNITIYPDPAGNQRSTKNINITDMSILEAHGFKDLKYSRRIASVRDCLNALNNVLSKDQIRFDPKCEHAIADLEQVQLKDNGDLDKSDAMLTHFLDGIKNLVNYEFPVVRPLGSSHIQL